LAALGHDSVLTSGLVPELGRRPVIFGANLLAQLKLKPPPGAILYNLEQVQQGSAWLTPALLDLFRHYPVWDYSRRNVAQLVAMGVPTPALVPIGWAPQLSHIAPMAEEPGCQRYPVRNRTRLPRRSRCWRTRIVGRCRGVWSGKFGENRRQLKRFRRQTE
jgi:hypothetical protein